MGVLRARVSGSWVDIPIYGGSLPPGGTTAQLLRKKSGTDWDTEWVDPAGATAATWIAPTLQNGWTAYGAPYATPGYRKIGDVVYLRGLVRNGTTTNNTVLLNLPAGYRPPEHWHFSCVSVDAFCLLRVTSGGDVQIGQGVAAGWLSLANIIFSVTL